MLPPRILLLTASAFLFGCGDNPATQQELPEVAGVTLTPSTVGFTALGDAVQLNAVATDAAGTVIPDRTFTWSSSDATVAPVVASGAETARVTALSNGSATISATTDGITGQASVAITAAAAHLRIVHTIRDVDAVDVLVDGNVVQPGLAFAAVSGFVEVPPGNHELAFRQTGTTGTVSGTPLSFAQDDSVTILTVDSSSIINPWVLTDTGAVVPAGKSKLRAVHFAEHAPVIDIWRTQPDFQSFITIMFPFDYRAASPYLQSDPGVWEILVSTEQRNGGIPVLTDTLLLISPIAVPAGESRTVLILDAEGGGLQASVIKP